MLDYEVREVLACLRVDEVPIPSTPSFNCGCEQCGTRVWVAYSSPIEPIRMCVACSAAHGDQIRENGDFGIASSVRKNLGFKPQQNE